MSTPTEAGPTGRTLALFGLVLYVATGVFPYLASGLVAPLWGIAVLWVGWLLGLWVTIRIVRRRSTMGPGDARRLRGLVITLGETYFDWTA